jgi:beta-1,2-mannobiose phosphorylase / 1,2-beta-oligomannan phosphorylase
MFHRHPQNPIIVPGKYDWRRAVVFNPGVIRENGKVYLYERAAGMLRPFICYIGMLESSDGVNFVHSSPDPVFTPEMAGSPYGSVQDPRVVKLDGKFYMTYAYRPYAWSSHPTGTGVPDSYQTEFPGFDGDPMKNQTRTGIAISDDLYSWKHFQWATPIELDDRDVILFPEKINGKYAMLRRPLQYVGDAFGTDKAGIWISFSDDMIIWDKGTLIAKPEFPWENNRIGGSLPPIRTSKGWLVIYHGVETLDIRTNMVIYRAGAMLLDINDPTRVLKRCSRFIMEPETYYEKFGLYIPNVIFPTGGYVENEMLHIYYGACDTAICRASVRVDELLDFIEKNP